MQAAGIRAKLPNQQAQGHPRLLRRATLQSGVQPARQKNQPWSAPGRQVREVEHDAPPENTASFNYTGFIMGLVGFEVTSIEMAPSPAPQQLPASPGYREEQEGHQVCKSSLPKLL